LIAIHARIAGNVEALRWAKEEEMHGSAIALLEEPKTSRRRDHADHLMQEIDDLRDHINRRAFEIFSIHGQHVGHELADWLQAEMEFLHPAYIEVSESPRTLTVRADVPGFKEKDLEIEVEPRRVTIAGKRVIRSGPHAHKRIYSEVSSDVILRVIDLPAAVDAANVKTTVKDGVLELDLSKVEPESN
jgi:HSP20 family molecular chaperone IbpA